MKKYLLILGVIIVCNSKNVSAQQGDTTCRCDIVGESVAKKDQSFPTITYHLDIFKMYHDSAESFKIQRVVIPNAHHVFNCSKGRCTKYLFKDSTYYYKYKQAWLELFSFRKKDAVVGKSYIKKSISNYPGKRKTRFFYTRTTVEKIDSNDIYYCLSQNYYFSVPNRKANNERFINRKIKKGGILDDYSFGEIKYGHWFITTNIRNGTSYEAKYYYYGDCKWLKNKK